MPAVPPECQALAADIAALQTADQNLRAQLTALVGADAWAALAKLGETRLELGQKQAQLNACIKDHSAAFQANLVVIDLTALGAAQASRMASLWEITAAGATQRETSAVTANTFSFTGPLPAQLAISIVTTGAADVIGPDFRSALIPNNIAGPVRVEVVIAPDVRIEAADLSQAVASAFQPVHQHISTGVISADVSLLTADATLIAGGIVGRVNGQIDFQAPAPAKLVFAGSATLSLVPSAVPGPGDLVEITATDPIVDAPGAVGLQALAVPLIRSSLSANITDGARNVLRSVLPVSVSGSLALPALPPSVTLSLRRVQIDSTAITFQPTLGAIGTVLSTFHPPVISPP